MIVITGIGLFFWSIQIIYEKQRIILESQVEQNLKNVVSDLDDEISASTEILYFISDLFKTFENITSEQFYTFISGINRKDNDILLLEWQPKVLNKNRSQFINKMKILGHKDFQIVEPDENGNLIKAKNRDVYFPVVYSYSYRGKNTTTGLDLAWSKERMESKFLARDKGEPMASNSFEVLLTSSDLKQDYGFAVSLPIYHTQNIPDSIIDRRKELKGFIASVIYLNALINPIAVNLKKHGFHLRIKDERNNTEFTSQTSKIQSIYTKSTKLNVYGQSWNVSIEPSAMLINNHFGLSKFLVPMFLFFFILLLILILYYIQQKNIELAIVRVNLEKALEVANSAVKSKMTFIANMSHEIRTPLNAILGYISIIQKDKNIEQPSHYLDRMKKNGELLQILINDILEISNLEENKLSLKNHNFDMNNLIDDIKDIVLTKNDNNNIQLTFSFKGERSTFNGDSLRLKQIIINLLSNSLKFTNKGRIDFSCTLKESLPNDISMVEFVVKDTGIGMDSQYIEHATKAFTQEDESFSREKGGLGLGLFICFNLVEQMKGEFIISSIKNSGTKVSFILPLKNTIHIPSDDKSYDMHKPQSRSQKYQILIAEDDDDTQFIVRTYLRELHADFDFVKNGDELLKKLPSKAYDLVLTDIQMPKLDGLSVTRTMREMGDKTPIVVMSAHTLEEEKKIYFNAGISAFIPKPLDQDLLLNTMKEFLN